MPFVSTGDPLADRASDANGIIERADLGEGTYTLQIYGYEWRASLPDGTELHGTVEVEPKHTAKAFVVLP